MGWLIKLVIALAFLVVVGVSGYAQSDTPAGNANADSSNQKSNDASEGAPGKQQRKAVEGTANPANQQEADEASAFSYEDKLNFSLSVALFIVVVVQVFIAFRQNKIADQQRQIMQKQIETTDIIERGYMGIADMSISNLIVGGRPTVTVKWVNGGRTPVMNFRAMPVVVFGNKPVTNKMYFIDDDISPIRGSFFPVGAEREIKYEVPDKIEEKDWLEFERGQSSLYILGTIYYRDITGAKRAQGISAMYDRHEEYVYETYAYSEPDDQS